MTGFHNQAIIAELIETAESGPRVVIDGTNSPKTIEIFSGQPTETAPATIEDTAATPSALTVTAPQFPGFPVAFWTLGGITDSVGTKKARLSTPQLLGSDAGAQLITSAGVALEFADVIGNLRGLADPLLDGTLKILAKAGSVVGASDVNGLAPAVVFDTAFPNGLITVIFTTGSQTAPIPMATLFSSSAAQFVAKWINTTTGNGVPSTANLRLNWLAIGW